MWICNGRSQHIVIWNWNDEKKKMKNKNLYITSKIMSALGICWSIFCFFFYVFSPTIFLCSSLILLFGPRFLSSLHHIHTPNGRQYNAASLSKVKRKTRWIVNSHLDYSARPFQFSLSPSIFFSFIYLSHSHTLNRPSLIPLFLPLAP